MGLKSQIRKLFRPMPKERSGRTVEPATSADLQANSTLEALAAQFPDIPPAYLEVYRSVKSLTMTSPERIFGLCQAVDHVVSQNLPGDLVECGVWRGGSSVAMIRTLLSREVRNRDLWLYDTFEGMTAPTKQDVDCFGIPADNFMPRDLDNHQTPTAGYCEAPLDDVRSNVERWGYPSQRVHYVKGKVEDTIPQQVPEQISLLRLDTDWFESTWHELIHLYPRLVPGGILIIDDYGHWQGCRQAVDQYLSENAPNLFLNRLDYTGRLAIKPHTSQGRVS